MVLGMSLSSFTLLHVVISLVAISSGIVVSLAMLKGKWLPGWTAFFLTTTALTSITGFLFPFEKLLPSHVLGVLSLIVLAIAVPARYAFHMMGRWRRAYVVTTIIALYFNVFVLVVQGFLKVPSLHKLAPNGSEPPFVIAQGIVLIVFATLGFVAVRSLRHTTAVNAAGTD